MTTNYYWFDPETATFFGPNGISHHDIMFTDKELSRIVDNILDKDHLLFDLYDILDDMNYVRLYFNQSNNELGISCSKNKSALKSIRNFIKKEPIIIESLFLDIKDIKVQTGLRGESIKRYINHGRIYQDQNI